MDPELREKIKKGNALFDQGKVNEGLTLLIEAGEKAPEFPDIHNQLGLMYCMLGSYQMAVNAFRKALELNTNYIEAHLNLSITFNEMGRYTEAVTEYEKAMKLEQVEGRLTTGMKAKLANAHKELGINYLEIEEFENAKQEFLKALKIAPQYLDIRTLLGNTYIKMQKYDEAIVEIEKVIGINPQYIDARIKLAVAHYRKGEKGTANNILKETLSFAPDNEKVKAFLKLSEKDHPGEL